MRRGYRLQALGYSFILYLLLPVACCLLPVHAADSTPSASVKAKLEALKAEIASKAAKLKQEVNRRLQNKAYIGVVKSKSESSITIASKTGTKLISINQDTYFEDKTKVKKGARKLTPSLKTLKEESNIAALGDVDDTGVLHARKIISLPSPTSSIPPKTIIWGQIISESDDLITIRTKDKKNEAVVTDEIKTKFKTDDFVIVTGVIGKNDILKATFLHVIPQGAVLKPKAASPSATQKPTGKPK